MKNQTLITFLLILFCTHLIHSQKTKQPLDTIQITGLKWRNIGPALTSGRISDIAVNPDNPYEYYVASTAGGVWKTTNAGIDYTPLFDGEESYSIGCVTIDPNNSNAIWIGSGENNNQRVVGYGDGVYKSVDGGPILSLLPLLGHYGIKEAIVAYIKLSMVVKPGKLSIN